MAGVEEAAAEEAAAEEAAAEEAGGALHSEEAAAGASGGNYRYTDDLKIGCRVNTCFARFIAPYKAGAY
jgi:hypothetical protein